MSLFTIAKLVIPIASRQRGYFDRIRNEERDRNIMRALWEHYGAVQIRLGQVVTTPLGYAAQSTGKPAGER